MVKVAAVFAVVLILLNLKLPLFLGMLGGAALLAVLFGISVPDFGRIFVNSLTSWETWEVVIALYVIMLLQQMLVKRKHLELAQESLNGLGHERRLNAALAAIFIGMMPSAAAVTICGKIMDDMAGDSLTRPEKAFCANYYRHIPEGILPTFPLIIIACSLSGVPVASFILGMLPMVFVLGGLAFVFYLRKVPKTDPNKRQDSQPTKSKKESFKGVVQGLWTIFVAILVIILFDVPTWLAVIGVIVVNIFVSHFDLPEMGEMVVGAFQWKIILGTIMVFVFKNVLVFTGMVDKLPDYFNRLPIPTFLTLALLFFFGSLVASTTAVGTTFVPLAFTMLPGGMPLLVLLMGFSAAASELSPTHVCLAVVSEYFDISLGALLKKTLPVVLSYCIILTGYYLILSQLF